MKYMIFLYFVIVFMMGCIEKPRKKLFIKSVNISQDARVDWYVYSSITSFAPDYLQVSSQDKEPFFVSFYLTGINFKNDSLYIYLWKNSYEKFDKSRLKDIKVLIDTTGDSWNGATSRFGRLKRAGVNIELPHFVDVYCPKGECYDYDTIPSHNGSRIR